MKEYKYAVVIGRFQPVHRAHITLIEKAFEIADSVIIVLGSNRSARTIKNPWTTSERQSMIESCFPSDYRKNIHPDVPIRLNFAVVKDYLYNDTYWMTAVYNQVKMRTGDATNDQIVLVGNNKDRSSFYLDLFPQWGKKEFKVCDKSMDATEIRNGYFRHPDWILSDDPNDRNYWRQLLYPNVITFLEKWTDYSLYQKLVDEFVYYANYKDSFGNVPFAVTFVTTDVVVIKSGHVLLIRRKVNPGKGLLALPGGFLNPDEWIIDCAFRELKEETRIKVDKKVLKEHVVDQRVFDHPDRSLRGRSITHAYCVKLPDGGELPQVRGDDDAERALWIPLGDLPQHEHEFFEDHLHVINHFTNKW